MKDAISKQSKRSNASVTEVIQRRKNVVVKRMELKTNSVKQTSERKRKDGNESQ